MSPANAEDVGSIPGSGRSPGRGHGNSLQYSGLENPMDTETWQDIVHRVAKNQTRLKWLSTQVYIFCFKYISPLRAPSVCHLPLECFLSSTDNLERPSSYWPSSFHWHNWGTCCSSSFSVWSNIVVRDGISAAWSLLALKWKWATQSIPSTRMSRRGFGLGLGGWAGRKTKQWPCHRGISVPGGRRQWAGGTAKPQLLESNSQDLLSHNVWKSVCMYVMMVIKWYMVSAKIVSTGAD